MSNTNRPKFWETISLTNMTQQEWEALCDGCGLCCLHKLEDAETSKVYYTKVACKLLDCTSCQCTNYPQRKRLVPECLQLNIDQLKLAQKWLPNSCAYKRLYLGKKLPKWHPLITGRKHSVHTAKKSAAHFALSEKNITENLEYYLL